MLVQAHEGRFVLAALRGDLFTAVFWSRSLPWRYQEDPLGDLAFQELLLELPWWEWEWEARKNVRAVAG